MYSARQQEAAWGDREAAAVDHTKFPGKDGKLTTDPRTGLPCRQVAADELTSCPELQKCVLHLFEPTKSSDGKAETETVFAVTDQTCFVYDFKRTKEKTRNLLRCFNVTDIQCQPGIYVSNDPLAFAVKVPAEYDLLLKFREATSRDAAIKAIRRIFFRATKQHLDVKVVNEATIDIASLGLNLVPPKNFAVSAIPQRTVDQLKAALTVVKKGDDKVIELLTGLQHKMDEKHFPKLGELQFTTDSITSRLVDVEYNIRQNEKELVRLRSNIEIYREIIEPVDGVFGEGGTELPLSKDEHVLELEILVARLNAARRAAGDSANTDFSAEDEAFLSQLYIPTTTAPNDTVLNGSGDALNLQAQSVWSQQKILSQEIEKCNKEITQMRAAEQEARALESRLKRIEERTIVLDHVLKTSEARVESAPPSVAVNLPSNYTQGLHQSTTDILRTDTVQAGGAWADSDKVVYNKKEYKDDLPPFLFPASS